jgi:hypothetical protein
VASDCVLTCEHESGVDRSISLIYGMALKRNIKPDRLGLRLAQIVSIIWIGDLAYELGFEFGPCV